MYTEHEYLYGWLFYSAGALIMIACFWFLIRGLRLRWLKVLLCLVVGVTLFTPWYAANELEFLAPAWLIAAYEGIFEGGQAFWRAGAPLLAAVGTTAAVALIVIILLHIGRRPAKRTAKRPATP